MKPAARAGGVAALAIGLFALACALSDGPEAAPSPTLAAVPAPAPTSLTTRTAAPESRSAPADADSVNAALAGAVLDRAQSAGLRGPALQRLLELNATRELVAIASAEPPPQARAAALRYERGLRITALEGLDRLADGEALAQVARRQRDPMLRWLAQVALQGMREGRPGKLGRAIDRILAKR